MELNKNGLLPCPFCGEVEDVVVKRVYRNGKPVVCKTGFIWYVECMPCDSCSGWHQDGDEDIFGKTGKELAIYSWNTRKI